MMESVQEAPDKEEDTHGKVANAALISDEDRSTGTRCGSMLRWLGHGVHGDFLYILTNWPTCRLRFGCRTGPGDTCTSLSVSMAWDRAVVCADVGAVSSRPAWVLHMFNQLLTQVLRAPMSFFDTTPLGRIVNRMSKDVYAIDETIPANWGMFSFITTICTVVYVTPWFSVILIPLGILYYASQRYFIKTSRELQRWTASPDPLSGTLTETLEGIRRSAPSRRATVYHATTICSIKTKGRTF
ncbi:hypothetical protein AaE_013355 [Aphanomyces astaci]|uniref:ABC transmembrane type-1 domain-containing protein n=1 Tax=Aphanomyces astaci TaxID=112090 RepID=A0A6A4Z456_APHAT|nr:hypothetical protein AaE_013355 [Aphanomyces astaci]